MNTSLTDQPSACAILRHLRKQDHLVMGIPSSEEACMEQLRVLARDHIGHRTADLSQVSRALEFMNAQQLSGVLMRKDAFR